MMPLSDERIATLISRVTQKLLGIRFGLAPPTAVPGALLWRAAFLDIGEQALTVALSSDESGCTALGAALFDVDTVAVSSAIINDSLAELVNMAAGQIKDALRIDKALGLPRVVDDPDRLTDGSWRFVRLRGDGPVEILVWMTDSDSDTMKYGASR